MTKQQVSTYVDRELPVIRNDAILRAARGEKCSRIPVWLMRQAGRYLPEYLNFTRDKDFFTVCRNPQWACEVTLQPIRRYDLDAAIIFSDILVLPQSLGWDFIMVPQQGPKCTNPLRSMDHLGCFLESLTSHFEHDRKEKILESYRQKNKDFIQEIEASITQELCDKIIKDSLAYVCEAIHVTRIALEGKVPLIGFCGAPWTLFTYITEGGGSKLYSIAKRWLYEHPDVSHCILRVLTGCISAFLIRQIDAGASLVQVFESHGGELPPDLFGTFCSPYLAQIARTVKAHRPDAPIMLFCKGTVDYSLGGNGLFDVLSVDSRHSVGEAARQAHGTFTVQGNLETAALHLPKKDLKRKVHEMIQSVSDEVGPYDCIPKRYIANLGHGVTPDIQPEAVETFIESIHSFRSSKHKVIS